MNLLRSASLILVVGFLGQPAAYGSEANWVSKDGRTIVKTGEPRALPPGWLYRAGNGTFRANTGVAFPLLLDGYNVGFYFHGGGSFTYELGDPAEWTTTALTLSKNQLPPMTITSVGRQLNCPVTEALVWTLDPTLPATSGNHPEGTTKKFRQTMDSFRKWGGIEPLQRLRFQALQTPAQPMSIAEIKGVGHEWIHIYDPFFDQAESFHEKQDLPLVDVEKEGRSLCRVVPLSMVPLGYVRAGSASPRITLSHVKLDITALNQRRLRVKAQEYFQIHTPGMRAIELTVLGRTYQAHGAARQLEPRPNRVTQVTDAEGGALPFHHQGHRLVIEFPSAPLPGTELILNIECEGDILVQPHGDNYWLLNQEGWFPLPNIHERAFTLEASMTTPKPFLPLLPGDQLERKETLETWTVRSKITRPVQMFWALAGKYTLIQDTRDDQTVRVATYANGGANAKLLLELSFDIIKFYQGFLGPFPFKDYLVAQIPELGFGIAPPGLQLITDEAFQPFSDPITSLYTGGINHRIAHEVAHQYWPHVVHIPDGEDAWLSESFAEYSSALFIKASRGGGRLKYETMVTTWHSRASESAGLAPLSMANRLLFWPSDQRGARRARGHLVYDKGAFLLYSLHKELGDLPFLKYLRAIQINFKGKQITTAHLQGLLEFMTKRDYSSFFDDYVHGTRLPPR